MVYGRLGDWQQLSLLLPDLQRYRVIQNAEYDNLERDTWRQLIKQTSQEVKRQMGSSFNTGQLSQQWSRLTSKLQKTTDLITVYANELISLGDGIKAEVLIRQTLNHNWSDELVRLYGLIPELNQSANSSNQCSFAEAFITAENWLKERPSNGVLLLCLGRLALRNQHWGKAREYFEASHQVHKTPDTYAELCRLAFRMDDKEASSQYLLDGVLSQVGLPDLPLPDLPLTGPKA